MAKEAQDREDLLRDASGLPFRVELVLQTDKTSEQTVVCGFRESGELSVYWGQETVLQFNADQELRRAYWNNEMVASYQRLPHWLKRTSSGGRARLERLELSAIERDDLAAATERYLNTIHQSIADGRTKIVGQVPADDDVVAKVIHWSECRAALAFSIHPGVGRKRRDG